MDPITLIVIVSISLIAAATVVFIVYNAKTKPPTEKILLELAGEMGLTYYSGSEGKPPFATGTYSNHGVTIDTLNEKGYFDRWHPHSRIVVSVDKGVKDTYIVANRGRFYSRKLGEVKVKHPKFDDKYVFLASNPNKGEKIVADNVAGWILGLDMPFILQDGHAVYHEDRRFEDKKRIMHIVDALIYIATMAEKVR